MPFCKAICEVSGFRLDTGNGLLAGYYCTVVFHSPTGVAADIGEVARLAVREHAAHRWVLRAGAAPEAIDIRIDDAWRISIVDFFWKRFVRPDHGATWYPPGP